MIEEDHDDFAFEPLPGLPAQLPAGETLLWQGSPDWKDLALDAFHLRAVTGYFALIAAWNAASGYRSGESAAEIATSGLWIAAAWATAIGLFAGLAYVYARGTIYTLTSRRIVIRSGLALPVTLNLPLALIAEAAVKRRGKSGGISLTVAKPNRVAWLVLWPNARPLHFTNPQPMLRALQDVDAVAGKVAAALQAEAGVRNSTRPVIAQPVDASPGFSGATLAA